METGAVGEMERSDRRREMRGSGRGADIRWCVREDSEDENCDHAGRNEEELSIAASNRRDERQWIRSGEREEVVYAFKYGWDEDKAEESHERSWEERDK